MDDEALVRLFSQASTSGWSLQSSIQLQDWLENFTKWMNARVDHVATQVNNLVDHTSKVEMDLRNTYNSFRLLSNSQFVEDRVHDEDEIASIGLESSRLVESKEIPFQSYESDIVPRYKEAVLTAWKAYDKFGRKVSKSSSLGDFQRDRRRLPYIIGSEDFERDNFCGLQEYSVSQASTYNNDFEKHQTTPEERPIPTSVINDREFSTTGSDTSDVEHMQKQGEPVVSAALDFKAMLEAALRGPYIMYDRFASSFTQESTGDHGSYSADDLGNVPGSGAGFSSADTISFSSNRIADDFPGGSSPKDGDTAHHKGDTSITLQNSSNSSSEDKSRISMFATVKKSAPAIATEQNNERALAGAQSSSFPISRLQIPMEKSQEKSSSVTEAWSTPSLDCYSPSTPDDRTEDAKGDNMSGILQHEDDSAVGIFDLNLFRKFKTLSSNKTNTEGGLFDDDFDEVSDELYGEMDSSISQKRDTAEKHKGSALGKGIQREDLVRPPLNEILSQISGKDAFPLANNSALSTISNISGSSSGLHASDHLGRTSSMLDNGKFGQSIVPASTWDPCSESEKQTSEQAQKTFENLGEKTAQVPAAQKSRKSGSTNDDDDDDDDDGNDFSSSSSTHSQGKNKACQIKPGGLEAMTSVEGKKFLTLKHETVDTYGANPTPLFTNSIFPSESSGKAIVPKEALPSQARLLQSTTTKHVSTTSSPQHFASTYNTMGKSIRDHDISTRQPREKAHKSSSSEAGSSYAVTGSKIEDEIIGVNSKSRAKPVVAETLKNSLFGSPPEKTSLFGEKSNTLTGPKETKPSLSAILFADDDEDQEDSLFGPLQVKSSRKTYNSANLISSSKISDMVASGSGIVKPVGVSGKGESDTKYSTQDLEKISTTGSDTSTEVHERERARSLFHD